MVDRDDLAQDFETRFGRRPSVYRAPGRINLIGEHTDYNDGFAMPMAFDRATWVAAAPRPDRRLIVTSREFSETATGDLDAPPSGPTGSWVDYVLGVAAVLDRDGLPSGKRLAGADLMIASDVPVGAGLSSSAALEMACGYALLDLASWPIELGSLARAGQRAEHEFVGAHCGLMDQTVACYGRAGAALLLDTRTFDHRWLTFPGSARALVCNTMVRHALASSEYNARRADCEAGVGILAERWPQVRALRDVSMSQLDEARSAMPERVYRRCRHVVAENARVLKAADALALRDFTSLGRLMNASHESLRDDYEVSCPELDTLSGIARRLEGVFGARLMGGGFGGSVVALVDARCAEVLQQQIRREYAATAAVDADVWVCSPGDGVARIS